MLCLSGGLIFVCCTVPCAWSMPVHAFYVYSELPMPLFTGNAPYDASQIPLLHLWEVLQLLFTPIVVWCLLTSSVPVCLWQARLGESVHHPHEKTCPIHYGREELMLFHQFNTSTIQTTCHMGWILLLTFIGLPLLLSINLCLRFIYQLPWFAVCLNLCCFYCSDV